MISKAIVLMIGIIVLPVLLFANTNGKIKGKVSDDANGSVLPGAEIRLENASFETFADLNGEYVFLGMPVGGYTLKCSIKGFRTVLISNVRVHTDLTTEIDFSLMRIDGDSSVIEIVADEPLINSSTSSSVYIRSAREIQKLPVRGYPAVAGLTAGVVQRRGDLHFRGGRAEETGYYVDGVYQNRPFNSLRAGDLSANAIEEVQVRNGGFNAEYGFAGSGLVHATTKTGGSRLAISGEMITDEFLSKENKSLGAYSYGYNLYNLSIGGPLLQADKARFFLSGERQFLRDQAPSSGVHPQLSNSLPAMVEGPVPGNSLSRWNWNGNVTIDVRPFQLKIGGNSTHDDARLYLHQFSMFNAERMPRQKERTVSYYLKATHTLGARSYYTATASFFKNEFEIGDNVWFDDLESYGDAAKNPQLRAPGVNPPTNDLQARFLREGTVFNSYRHNKSEYLNLKADFVHQAGSAHDLQAGFEYRYHTLRNYSIAPMGIASARYANPSLTDSEVYTVNYADYLGYDIFGKNEVDSGLNGAKHPVFTAAYVQDKIELSDLLVSLGLRWDYFDPAIQHFSDPSNIRIIRGKIDSTQLADTKSTSTLSPRLGLAFLVSEKTLFYANVGKFTQPPELNLLLTSYPVFATDLEVGSATQTGNAMLKPATSSAYEIGWRHQFGDRASLEITAFYKKIHDLPSLVLIFARPVPYITLANGAEGTVKGFSTILTLRRSRRFSADAAYTLQSDRGISGPSFDSLVLGNPPVLLTPEAALDFDQRHTLILNMDIRNGHEEGPRLWGGYPLSRAGINLLFTLGSGFPYTPGHQRSAVFTQFPNSVNRPTDGINSEYTPSIYSLDAKLDKSITFGKVELNVYLWAINLLGRKNVTEVYEQTGKPDDDGYLSTSEGRFFAGQFASAVEYYKARINDPFNFGAPRQFRLGLRFDWR